MRTASVERKIACELCEEVRFLETFHVTKWKYISFGLLLEQIQLGKFSLLMLFVV